MDVHKNAPLTPCGREAMVRRVVEGGQTPEAVGEAIGVCPRTVRKWVARFSAEGVAGLQDRSSRPHRPRCLTPPEIVARVEALRRQRWSGTQIAQEVGVSKATVFRVLGRLGLNRLKALEPAEPVRRYEHEHPGELIHIDIKSSASSTAPATASPAERFIQTALREWAYAKAYERSNQRGADLPLWIHRYNWHRPHGNIGAVPPISRIGSGRNNLLRLHS